MFQNQKVIDVHGHMSTPPHFRGHLGATISLNTPGRKLEMSDEALANAQKSHIKGMDERNIDVQLIGPRPVAMWQWTRPFLQQDICRVTNDVIARIVKLHPDRFYGMAQLPQNSQLDTSNCVAELERCVTQLGFVGAYVNPDPSGRKDAPGMNDPYWHPLYKKAQELDVPLMVHPSTSFDPRIEVVPHNYQMNNYTEEFIAMHILSHSNVFELFPRLRIVICHCGGALNRFIPTDHHIAQKDLSKNLFYDCCAYDDNFLTAAIKQKGVDQMMFGTEFPGSGGAARPDTGKPSDDVLPVIDSLKFLSGEDKLKIFRTNALRVFTKVKAS
ncbi:MAG TPA: amidohydrolase family protein [Candidatus Binatia bacterium]